ncbi:uncharacterized protein LOC126787118 [Argentina anserina]|uniref:uncharacterized protein LOC126787118 n=1 Tax=Argentina anserina TaxID=57926 RepID=UPI0021768F79|nr:uncharacterized protein LOC126787118 [Potentilla anserina]
MNEVKELVMVSPTGEDPSHEKPFLSKPILPCSSIDEPFKLSQGFISLPVPFSFDPKGWPLKLHFTGWRLDHYDLQTWVEHLAPVHQSTWKKAGIFKAILNSTYKIKRNMDLVCGLAEKWCCETNTFVFPWGEATITLEDITVLGGFSVLGDSIFSPLESRELREVKAMLEKERMGICDYSVGCRTVTTKAWMEKFMKSGSELEHEAFLVFWLSTYVFNNTSNSSVNEAVFSTAIRLARGIQVVLADTVLAQVYKDLSVLRMKIAALSGLKDVNEIVEVTVMSPFHLVQVWAWERFVELRPKSNVICSGEPRLARWDDVDCLNVGDMRRVLYSAGQGFVWRPYAMDIKNYVFPVYNFEIEKWVLVGPDFDDEHGLMSFAMFLSVAKLIGFGTKQNYFPHRVAMQFGFNQDLQCSCSAGYTIILENGKWYIDYIPPKVSEADDMRYVKWGKESVSHEKQKEKEKEKNVTIRTIFLLRSPFALFLLCLGMGFLSSHNGFYAHYNS